MTISELGSLGEVVGAIGLIVTLVFLAMEMRLKRQSEDNKDLEQLQVRALELLLGAAENSELSKVLSKWNKLTGGIFLPLPPHVNHATLQDIFDEEELTTLNYYHLATAMNYEMILTKWERRSIPEKSMKVYDTYLENIALYLIALNSGMIPRRLRERYLTDHEQVNPQDRP